MRAGIAWIIVVTSALALATTVMVPADEPPQPAKLFVYSGVLRSMDLKARTITVSGSDAPQKFTVPTDAEIIVKDKPKAELSDLMVGDSIQVKYTDEEGGHVAHQILILGLKTP